MISTDSGERGRGGKEGPGAGSTSFPASGGGGEADGNGEKGPRARSASFPTSGGGGKVGGGGEEGLGARCAKKLSMRVEILSSKDYNSDLTSYRRMVISSCTMVTFSRRMVTFSRTILFTISGTISDMT